MLTTLALFGAAIAPLMTGPGPAALVATADAVKLRAEGPAAVTRLVTQNAELLNRGRTGVLRSPADKARFDTVRKVIDTVAGARDAWASGLFWYDTLDAAKAAAKRTGKPILSLRMLGRLTDELSCANSRFFRTMLYPDATVAALLRDHFVLHWSSERAVPVVTIDMGDGRVMKTTVTGNSAHYVLSASGQALDVIPGLVAANEFAAALKRAQGLHARLVGVPTARHRAVIRAYHTAELARIAKLLTKTPDIARKLGVRAVGNIVKMLPAPAAKALPIAMGKKIVEAPIIVDKARLDEGRVDSASWERAGKRLYSGAALTPEVIEVIAWKSGWRAAKRVNRPLQRRIAALRKTLAADTARNQLDLHRTIHSWLAAEELNFESLNKRVYSELFLTPRTDAWLGLAGAHLYNALPSDGISVTTATK